jgi:long-subunit fatty acid transport protein
MNTQLAVAPGATIDPANERTTVALGLNYRPIPQVAVKADFTFQLNAARTGRNQFNLALGYLF